jgi:HNH endonuclease
MKPCKCGCGLLIEETDKEGRPHEYQVGHNGRKIFGKKPLLNPLIPCACGCGNMITKYDKKGRARKFHPKHRDSGQTHSCWKGGRIIDSNGYVKIWKPEHPYCQSDGYVFEHRLVLEEKLGRYLTEEEQTHHINHNRKDNRPENLMVIDSHEHGRLHATIKWNKR